MIETPITLDDVRFLFDDTKGQIKSFAINGKDFVANDGGFIAMNCLITLGVEYDKSHFMILPYVLNGLFHKGLIYLGNDSLQWIELRQRIGYTIEKHLDGKCEVIVKGKRYTLESVRLRNNYLMSLLSSKAKKERLDVISEIAEIESQRRVLNSRLKELLEYDRYNGKTYGIKQTLKQG